MLNYMPQEMIDNWSSSFNFNLGWRPEDFRLAQESWPKVEQLVRMLHDNKILLTAGTDANNPWVVPGDSFHTELELLNKCGLSTGDVLRIATLNGAKMLGISHRTGLVKKGYEADLVLLEGNPLEDIRNTRKINVVINNGKKLEPSQIKSSLR